MNGLTRSPDSIPSLSANTSLPLCRTWPIILPAIAHRIGRIVARQQQSHYFDDASEAFQKQGSGRDLVVILHGFRGSRNAMEEVREVVLNCLEQNADTLVPNMPLGMLSCWQPSTGVACLVKMIDDKWKEKKDSGKPYERIILIGHSTGSILARKLYVIAEGEKTFDEGDVRAPFGDGLHGELSKITFRDAKKAREWATAVDRIILLAGLNRGWSVSRNMSIRTQLRLNVGLAMNAVLTAFSSQRYFIMETRRGAPFITQLRLEWLAMRQWQKKHHDPGKERYGAKVFQLLGTIDDLVPPSDNIDPVVGRDFRYLEVPHSNHFNVIRMGTDKFGPARADKLNEALKEPLNQRPNFLPAEVDASYHAPDESISDVVFVVHGIRDLGFWAEKIARRIVELGEAKKPVPRKFASVCASYGYFPMLSFLRPEARRLKMEWLMDQVAQAKARFPEARRFSYVGHSHGTYLLGKALECYPAIKFENVFFAGSVMRTRDRWPPHRVKNAFNVRASADWVVAWFPNLLEQLHIQDVGGGGFFGFRAASKENQLDQFVEGTHSAALDEQWWDSIAKFIVEGEFAKPNDVRLLNSQNLLVKLGGIVPVAIWAIIFALTVSVFCFGRVLLPPEWENAWIFFFGWAIWLLLTKA